MKSAALNRALDRTTHSRNIGGNEVTGQYAGKESFARRLALIANAKDFVYMQTFSFNIDDSGWMLARALVNKAKQGVTVRLIFVLVRLLHVRLT